MSKQIQIHLDEETYAELSSYAAASGGSIQTCAAAALRQYLDRAKAEPVREGGGYRFIDLFAGIGGMRLAFESAGGQCVYSNEWNRYCQKTYFVNFGVLPEGDITKVRARDIPDHDILVAGFPCQPFSIAGVSKKKSLGRATGFEDKTQGTLFFDICRILREKRPKAFLLENVKNLCSHDRGRTFQVIQESLEELNYEVFPEVIDGRRYVPQHRERIVIVGFDRERYGSDIRFQFLLSPPQTPPAVRDILEADPDRKYTLTDHLWTYLQDYAAKHREAGNGFGYGIAPPEGAARTLSARYYKDGSEILIRQEGANPRRLTPRECARLQGFPDTFQIPVSDTQAYRQFGNSVVVPLMSDVAGLLVAKLGELDQALLERLAEERAGKRPRRKRAAQKKPAAAKARPEGGEAP